MGQEKMNSTRRMGLEGEFFGPDHLIFGSGSIAKVQKAVEEIAPHHVLIIADQNVPVSKRLETAIAAVKLKTVVTEVRHNGAEPSLVQAKDLANAGDRSVDLIVAIGGGSSIDIAKAVAVILRAPQRSVSDFEGANKIPFAPVPVIAIPTTAGTGSEATGSCVLTDTDTDRKLSIRSPKLRPRLAILDPQLLATVPEAVIRATGIDALAHGLEAWLSTGGNVITDRFALGAISHIAGAIGAYYAHPEDENAAAAMAIGSCMAGIAFNSARVGLAHAVASATGPLTGLSHGLSVGLALPVALQTNLCTRTDDRLSLLTAIGLADRGDDMWIADVLSWLSMTYAQIGFPSSTVATGRTFTVTDTLVENIVNSGRLDTNPVKLSPIELDAVLRAIHG